MGYLFCLMLAAIALTFWIMGALKPRRRTWVMVLVWPAAIVLGFYFFVQLGRSTTGMGEAQVGYPQLIAMIAGLWALLAKPKAPPPARNHNDDRGATA